MLGDKCESEEDIEELDEEQIMEIFKEEGIFKRENSEFNDQNLYLIVIDGKQVEIECESAFYCLSKKNFIRIYCTKAIKHPLWEATV
jgi:hypothetical protein